MTKFVFVTGGVVSSLGKGIAAASLAAILASRGVRVTNLKLDPYINVDPGTMSPFQHGEVFVTDDGAETDLDLGHYERFTDVRMGKRNNFTTGQIYEIGDPQGAPRRLPGRHGAGDPAHHRRDQGVDHRRGARATPTSRSSRSAAPWATSSRCRSSRPSGRWASTLGRDNVCYIHLTLVPYIPSAGEMKTKPTQHSVKELREIGIQPDVVLCRADRPVPEGDRKQDRAVHQRRRRGGDPGAGRRLDLQDPRHAARRGARRHRLPASSRIEPAAGRPARRGTRWSTRWSIPQHEVHIAMVGKYVDLTESYKSLSEALIHAGIHTRCEGQHPLRRFRDDRARRRRLACAAWTRSWCRAASASAASKARSRPIRYARENGIPYLGICLGMQLAVIEYARHMAGLAGANSTEFDPRHAASGRGADHRMAEPRRHDRAAHAKSPTWAARCAWARSPATSCPGSLAHRIYGATRSPSATATATRSTTITCRGSRPRACRWARGPRARPPATCRDDRAARTIRGSSAASSTRSSRPIRAAAIRCS